MAEKQRYGDNGTTGISGEKAATGIMRTKYWGQGRLGYVLLVILKLGAWEENKLTLIYYRCFEL